MTTISSSLPMLDNMSMSRPAGRMGPRTDKNSDTFGAARQAQGASVAPGEPMPDTCGTPTPHEQRHDQRIERREDRRDVRDDRRDVRQDRRDDRQEQRVERRDDRQEHRADRRDDRQDDRAERRDDRQDDRLDRREDRQERRAAWLEAHPNHPTLDPQTLQRLQEIEARIAEARARRNGGGEEAPPANTTEVDPEADPNAPPVDDVPPADGAAAAAAQAAALAATAAAKVAAPADEASDDARVAAPKGNTDEAAAVVDARHGAAGRPAPGRVEGPNDHPWLRERFEDRLRDRFDDRLSAAGAAAPSDELAEASTAAQTNDAARAAGVDSAHATATRASKDNAADHTTSAAAVDAGSRQRAAIDAGDTAAGTRSAGSETLAAATNAAPASADAFGRMAESLVASSAVPTTSVGGTTDSTTATASPAASAEHTIAHAPGTDAFTRALGSQVTLWAREGTQEARLALNPADLGPVTVHIAVDGAQARVEFHAQMQGTRDAIEASLPALAGALSEQGLTLAGGGVFDRGGRDAAAQQSQPSRAEGRGDGPGTNGAQAGVNGAAGVTGSARSATPRGLVDLIA